MKVSTIVRAAFRTLFKYSTFISLTLVAVLLIHPEGRNLPVTVTIQSHATLLETCPHPITYKPSCWNETFIICPTRLLSFRNTRVDASIEYGPMYWLHRYHQFQKQYTGVKAYAFGIGYVALYNICTTLDIFIALTMAITAFFLKLVAMLQHGNSLSGELITLNGPYLLPGWNNLILHTSHLLVQLCILLTNLLMFRWLPNLIPWLIDLPFLIVNSLIPQWKKAVQRLHCSGKCKCMKSIKNNRWLRRVCCCKHNAEEPTQTIEEKARLDISDAFNKLMNKAPATAIASITARIQ